MTALAQRTPADLLLAGLLGMAIALAFVRLWAGAAGTPSHAVVYVGDAAFASLPLDQDQTLRVPGRLGDSLIAVEGGGVRFVDSPCSHKLCMRAGLLRQRHEAAACVPNRVSVGLSGGQSEYDGVNF